MDDRDYARLVASGAVSAVIPGLREARDLLESIEHPTGARLRTALLEAALAQQELAEERSDWGSVRRTCILRREPIGSRHAQSKRERPQRAVDHARPRIGPPASSSS